MLDRRNMADDGIEPVFWDMVEAIAAQIENAIPILWTRDGVIHFLKQYDNGSQTIIEWKFDKADFKDYLERQSRNQRETYVQQIGTMLNDATATKEALNTPPANVRRVGDIPKAKKDE